MELNFSDISKNDDGEYFVRITNGSGKPVFSQQNKVEVSNVTTDEVTIQCSGDAFTPYDDAVMEYAKEHRQDWFGRDISDKVLANAYQHTADDGNVTVIPRTADDGSPLVQYYGLDREPKEYADLQVGASAKVVLELYGLWFVKKNFGPVWRLIQAQDLKPPDKCPYADYLFQDTE